MRTRSWWWRTAALPACLASPTLGDNVEGVLRGAGLSALLGVSGGEVEALSCELADGRLIAVSQHSVDGGGWVSTYEDVTERRAAESRLAHMARHDMLTGLPNRLLFSEFAQQLLAKHTGDSGIAMLCLGLDRFKTINDTFGHAAGDTLLQAVAERIKACVRDGDQVSRLGGDEFAVVQMRAGQPSAATALACRLIEVLSEPFEIDSSSVQIGVSIGIVLGENMTVPRPELLLQCADLALARAKTDGGGCYRFFEAAMDMRMQARRALEVDLRGALGRNELELFYQPQVSADRRLTGFEALLRWHHPRRGLVSPAEFIPLAEELGLIGSLGNWVLTRACTAAASWPAHLEVAVNLSPVQFRGRILTDDVAVALASSGLAPGRLELEITEAVLMGDDENVLTTLHLLRGLGVRIAMDDFGTGYSSLGYLRRFPFDKIKIDQSFVQGMTHRDDCMAIVARRHRPGPLAQYRSQCRRCGNRRAAFATSARRLRRTAGLPVQQAAAGIGDRRDGAEAWAGDRQGEGRGSFLKKEPKNFCESRPGLNEQKFFGSFFQKRIRLLPPPHRPNCPQTIAGAQMAGSALVVGSSGIVGSTLAASLAARNWTVHGLARKPLDTLAGVSPVAADLLDPVSLRAGLQYLRPSHVFITTWMRQATEAENIRVNSAMVRNLLHAVSQAGSVRHVALVTGLKHYLGPFEAYGHGTAAGDTISRRTGRALMCKNFYYAQEDEVFAAAERARVLAGVSTGLTPSSAIAVGNAMNMGVTLAVYATLCRETGRPVLSSPASPMQWNGLTDMTDARLLAQAFASGPRPARRRRNQALNIVNGDVFPLEAGCGRRLAGNGLGFFEAAPLSRPDARHSNSSWPTPARSVGTYRQKIFPHGRARICRPLTSQPWHTDADLGRPIEVVTDMSKSRKLGFLDYQATDDGFFDLFARLREARLIPPAS